MNYRIGVDVGGTFTDAVVLNATTHEVIGFVKVPTTHSHPKGVSAGIKQAISKLIEDYCIDTTQIDFIAHGTTQVTNALLEGDVEGVAVISTAKGPWAFRVKDETSFKGLHLGAGKSIPVNTYFIKDLEVNTGELQKIYSNIKQSDIECLVSATAYSVDDARQEEYIKQFFIDKGFHCTATNEMTSLYGLRTRTKTAIINASVMPKMVETTNYMIDSIQSTGITKPLMIMRSDGGVMNATEVSKRPIQTIMSGPASGVSGAILHAKISEGIFLEVGGTSTDISVIHNGRVMVKWAQIGELKTYTTSLDIRTEAIAGGSILRIENEKVVCGPRSAHIANLEYVCFAENLHKKNISIHTIKPEDDSVEYLVLHDTTSDKNYALTLTCLANYTGYVEETNFAKCKDNTPIAVALECLSEYLHKNIEKIIDEVFCYASNQLKGPIYDLLDSYHLKSSEMVLVGGGGGAAAVVPMLSNKLGIKMQSITDAHIISPIGVAISMVREVVERSIQNPTEDELQKLQNEAIKLAIASGASASKVDVLIESEPTKNIVRAIASGVTENAVSYKFDSAVSKDQMLETIAQRNNFGTIRLEKYISANYFDFFVYKTERKSLWQKLLTKKTMPLFVLSKEGTVRLVKELCELIIMQQDKVIEQCTHFLDKYSNYTDAGERIPEVFMILGDKIYDYSSITTREQLLTLIGFEVLRTKITEDVYFVFTL